ncbi:hypothetical protein [Trinickia soli]|uniref:Uncharacterized protein n=1 Tax=Trinickia soli TaxID=380675 RepID=A0A2N7VHF7_9BURK|nr:hypothetical protein [Trinickia soli]PMS16581.1 hypothetical protein C0Z19_25585 [Trinickia soli]CAB3676692.1 hypothetical protein LMG24076_02210 [Trinickia soli]
MLSISSLFSRPSTPDVTAEAKRQAQSGPAHNRSQSVRASDGSPVLKRLLNSVSFRRSAGSQTRAAVRLQAAAPQQDSVAAVRTDKGKSALTMLARTNAPKPRTAHEAGQRAGDGASTSASAPRRPALVELMHAERETETTRYGMALIRGPIPKVRWADGIPEIDRAEKVAGLASGQHPPVARKVPGEDWQAINDQVGRNKRYEKVFGEGSLPIEDDDATGEPVINGRPGKPALDMSSIWAQIEDDGGL